MEGMSKGAAKRGCPVSPDDLHLVGPVLYAVGRFVGEVQTLISEKRFQLARVLPSVPVWSDHASGAASSGTRTLVT